MKKAFIAIVLMTLFMTLGGGLISKVFSLLLGGGLEQSYLYPIYGGIIVLTGVVVGASQLVIDEIKKLEKLLDDKKKDAYS